MLPFNQSDCVGDYFFGEIRAKKSKELVVIKTIPDICLSLKDFTKIIKEALTIEI